MPRLVHQRFLTSPLSLHLAVAILDDCLKLGKPSMRPRLLASLALSVAGKFEDVHMSTSSLYTHNIYLLVSI